MTDTPPPYVPPEQCPDPSVHGNPFRYCPYCSWTEQGPIGEIPTPVPAAPGPARRAARGVQQQVIGLLLSIPVSVGALTAAGVDVDPQIAAIAVGVPTALAGIVSGVWNLVDAVRGNG